MEHRTFNQEVSSLTGKIPTGKEFTPNCYQHCTKGRTEYPVPNIMVAIGDSYLQAKKKFLLGL